MKCVCCTCEKLLKGDAEDEEMCSTAHYCAECVRGIRNAGVRVTFSWAGNLGAQKPGKPRNEP